MNICSNCGELLPEGETLCPKCGAEQQTNRQKKGRKGSAGKKHSRSTKAILALSVVAGVLAVLLAAGSIATTLLYKNYNSEDAVDAFGAALMAGDTASLQTMIKGEGVSVTSENLAALCRAFNAQETVDALKTQLKAQAAGQAPAQVVCSALSVAHQKVFLGYSSYAITARPVSLRVPSSVQSPLLTVDGAARTGETDEQGVLYTGLFPGAYSCIVSGQSVTGERLLGTETMVSLLDADAPGVFDGALALNNITVENCQSDAAVIAVNGTEVAAKPVNGVVSLTQVAVGSTVTMRYTTEYGATISASVQFADAAATALRFENHVSEGGIPPEDQLNALLGAYYASYLDCLNNQDISLLKSSTTLNAERLAPGLAAQENKNKLFVFKSAAARYASAVAGFAGEEPSTTVNAEFAYSYSHREKKEEGEGVSRQTIELVFRDGGWLVNRTVECTDENFDANTFTSLG